VSALFRAVGAQGTSRGWDPPLAGVGVLGVQFGRADRASDSGAFQGVLSAVGQGGSRVRGLHAALDRFRCARSRPARLRAATGHCGYMRCTVATALWLHAHAQREVWGDVSLAAGRPQGVPRGWDPRLRGLGTTVSRENHRGSRPSRVLDLRTRHRRQGSPRRRRCPRSARAGRTRPGAAAARYFLEWLRAWALSTGR
jgi:hypothetical protein